MDIFKVFGFGINRVNVEIENFEDWMSIYDISNLFMDKFKEMCFGVLLEVVDFRNIRFISVEDGV